MKTFPCIRGKIGDWTYYTTNIRMTELVNYVKFADQIFPRNDLDQVMQRDLTNRSLQISDYLLKNEQRFMGSLIVAAVGGEPKFVPISFGDESVYSFAEGKLGFLRFDGSEQYYALDGQHRLAAIKDALSKDSKELAKDEVSLIIVWHDDNDEGRTRARRLFTTVNRYAKKTSKAEDIAFDEDNPVDIYTRRLVREHKFLKERTKVTNLARQGEFKLSKSEALKPEDKYDRNFLFALLTLRRCNEILLKACFLDRKVEPQVLPSFETLEEGYGLLVGRWKVLIDRIGPWQRLAEDSSLSLDEYRLKSGGHPLVRPIAIVAFVAAVSKLLDKNDDVLVGNIDKVSAFFSDITQLPFRGLLWKEEKGGMHDGQARRNATADLFSYFLNGEPEKIAVVTQWSSAAGRAMDGVLQDRNQVLE
jgi:DNA sulfur modification protein DndB